MVVRCYSAGAIVIARLVMRAINMLINDEVTRQNSCELAL